MWHMKPNLSYGKWNRAEASGDVCDSKYMYVFPAQEPSDNNYWQSVVPLQMGWNVPF